MSGIQRINTAWAVWRQPWVAPLRLTWANWQACPYTADYVYFGELSRGL